MFSILWWLSDNWLIHSNDVTMTTMASQITNPTAVYLIVYSGADQRKHQISASLAFVRGIHNGPVTRIMFVFDDIIMFTYTYVLRVYAVCTAILCLIHKVYVLRNDVFVHIPARSWTLDSMFFIYVVYRYNTFYKDSYIIPLFLNALKYDILNMYSSEAEGLSRYQMFYLLAASGVVASTALCAAGLVDASTLYPGVFNPCRYQLWSANAICLLYPTLNISDLVLYHTSDRKVHLVLFMIIP